MTTTNGRSDDLTGNAPPSTSGESPPAYPSRPPVVPPRDYYRDDPRMKSPALATILSIMPGLGQVYVGYYQQGFMYILIVASAIALLNRGAGSLEPLLGFFLAFFWLFNLVDAARRASFFNQAIAQGGSVESLGEFQLPSRRGGLFAGVVMILLGLLALANIQFGWTFHWLERWWPVALVLVGGYLVYQSVSARKKSPIA